MAEDARDFNFTLRAIYIFPAKRKRGLTPILLFDARNLTMTELSLNCLPVGMTSVGKNVYPVCNTWDESDGNNDDVTTENFEGRL